MQTFFLDQQYFCAINVHSTKVSLAGQTFLFKYDPIKNFIYPTIFSLDQQCFFFPGEIHCKSANKIDVFHRKINGLLHAKVCFITTKEETGRVSVVLLLLLWLHVFSFNKEDMNISKLVTFVRVIMALKYT